MPVAGNDVEIDSAAVFELVNSETGPVGDLMRDLSERAAAIARAKVRVRSGGTRSMQSDARPPGFTRASIRTAVNRAGSGLLYGGIGAAEDPSVFLEEPAEQMDRTYPFLTTGVYSLEGQV